MNTAYLGLGSNLGDRRQHLAGAVRRLHGAPGIQVMAVSAIYESSPVGVAAQPDFLNLVVQVATLHPPHEFLGQCLRIEAGLGRERRERWGPRTIDIDVLLYGDVGLADENLTVPHPRMAERSFVLTPLAEIAPGLRLAGETVGVLATRLGSAGLRRLGPLDWAETPVKPLHA
ncbi:MAG TPA: 2-amino-4-hydroxy-6-hydroxymethyldihydropteridine diphosphokinase [Opitutaceae bacterium]|nr:2-amino-4-hydroxy-6-hydroxymethyldihydropteridine diphosphokinase [Opitutaceae bacterium]